jgi:signal transduction histidine kinase
MTRLSLFRDVRTRLLAIVLTSIVVALVAATAIFNALLAHTTANDVDALLRQRATSERAMIDVVGGRIRISETTDDALADSRIWIYQGNQAIEAPPARPGTQQEVDRLVGGRARYTNVSGTDIRLYAAPIKDRTGRRVGTIVVGRSLAPYEQTRKEALVGSLALAGALLVLVGVAVWWLLRSALRPVARMTEQAAVWSERDLDRRFALGDPHDELTRLGATLDGLLDRLAASLRHERRFSAELSHELRTPLSRVIAEAELALRRERSGDEYREALERILANGRQVSRIVETLLAAARHESAPAIGTADAYAVAESVVASYADAAADRGVSLYAARPVPPVRLGVDGDLAARALQPVVENACRYGRSRVTIRVEKSGSRVSYLILDDGPGIADDERDAVFEPGVRGRTAAGTDGAGLGLALARRIARTLSGEVELVPGLSGGGFRVVFPGA